MNMRKTTILLFLALGALLVQSCKKTDYEKIEQDTIREFLKQNDITAEPTESGLYYIEKEAGTGLQPVDSDTVSINYIAYKLTGLVFDTNIESVAKQYGIYSPTRSYAPMEFVKGAGQVIEGMDEGVGYMKEGGKATLVVPSKLAYHNYEPLAFYVELIQVKHDTTAAR
jgi:FKBP-type peptidyl-prolyl cis-trans isomerase